MKNRVLLVSTILALVGFGLATADAMLKERPHELGMNQEEQSSSAPITLPEESSSSAVSSVSSSVTFVKKGVSTRKKSGVDVSDVLARLQFIETTANEASILQLTASITKPHTEVLLQNNDRAALLSWIESDDVKMIFSAVKQALQEQFSPKLKDLVDETQTQTDGPPVDILSFIDPTISAEKIVFLRVRTRLYEFHIAPKSEVAVQGLIEALSK